MKQIEQIEPRDFAALYQQDPISEGGTEWPPEYFSWDGFWFDDWPSPENTVLRVMSLDPSMADSDHAGDYQALIVLYLDKQARVYVDAFLVRLDATRLVEFAVNVWQQHQATAFAVATNVRSGMITSSPGPKPSAASARCNPVVPLLTASAYSVPQ